MTIAGISQPTWKWTPSSWISDHWSITVSTRKPKIRTARPIWRARRTLRLRGGFLPTRDPASPTRCRNGWRLSTSASTLVGLLPVWDSRRMGEFELLAKLRERLPAGGSRIELGSGDDAAVTVPGGATATSVDAIVEGVHFRRGEAGLETIGRKALATALSDLAAMGAEAGEAYVVLGAPTDLAEEDLLALLDGMLELAEATGTTIAGGDLTRAPALTLAVTVVGHGASPT